MTTRKCSVGGCTRAAKKFAHICSAHQKNRRRWGHETQRPITVGEMKRYAAHVRKLIDTRPNADAIWGGLKAAFNEVKREAAAEVADKAVGFRWKRSGEKDILTVCAEADAEAVMLQMVALGYMRDFDERRFVNDAAFFTSAGRRFRALGRSFYNATTNPTTGRRHLTMKDAGPRQQHHVGTRLMSAFAAAGVALRALEVAEERKAAEARTAAAIAIYASKPRA